MKVVIDTNIIIHGASDEQSVAFKIIKEAIEGRIEAFATHQTMGENRQMLRKLVRDREYRELLEEYFQKVKIVNAHNAPLTPSLPVRQASYLKRELGELLKDEEDYKLFESALAAGAEYLITNDKEVLAVEQYHNCKIVPPDEFWAIYKNETDDGSAWNDWARMLMGN